MSMESFKILKEINSLSIKREEYISLIEKEEKRVLCIKNNRKDRKEDLEDAENRLKESKSELLNEENSIARLSQKIEKDQNNLNSLIDENAILSIQKQIEEMKSKLSSSEEKGLDLLEIIENIESEIKDAKEFLNGSLESLKEIEQEVNERTADLKEKIEGLNKRESLLMQELPPLFKSKIELILSKKLKFSNFSRIKENSCEFCRFNLSKVDIIAIEDNLTLKTCQGCSRIFIPIQAGY